MATERGGSFAVGNGSDGSVVDGSSRSTLYDGASMYFLDDGVQFSLIDKLLSRRCEKGAHAACRHCNKEDMYGLPCVDAPEASRAGLSHLQLGALFAVR